MKKFFAVILAFFAIAAHAQTSVRTMAMDACFSGKDVIYKIVKARDNGVPLPVVLNAINEVTAGPGDDENAVSLTQVFSTQAAKDAYGNRKMDKYTIFTRYYNSCLQHFGITDSSL